MLKLVNESQYAMRCLHTLRIFHHKMLFNYEGKKNNFAVEKADKHLEPGDQG